MKNFHNNHGGKRKNAGRPPLCRKPTRVTAIVTPETARWLHAQPGGASATIRRWAEMAMAEDAAVKQLGGGK